MLYKETNLDEILLLDFGFSEDEKIEIKKNLVDTEEKLEKKENGNNKNN